MASSASRYEWAHHTQLHVAEASTIVEEVTARVVELAIEFRGVDLARSMVIRGLRCLPGDERLYWLRRHIEHRAGNTPAVHGAYRELQRFLDELDIGARPSLATMELYRTLVCGQP